MLNASPHIQAFRQLLPPDFAQVIAEARRKWEEKLKEAASFESPLLSTLEFAAANIFEGTLLFYSLSLPFPLSHWVFSHQCVGGGGGGG